MQDSPTIFSVAPQSRCRSIDHGAGINLCAHWILR